MSKVESYIEQYTRMCSNVVIGNQGEENTPWLTPDHARAVATIAREEALEKVMQVLGSLVKELQDKENECYRQMAFCNEHKFEMEREALRYRQQAYNRCWMDVSDAKDKIEKLLKTE